MFFERLAGLSELFNGPGAVFSEVKAELYFEALRDLPFEAVSRALNQAVRVCTFMPKPAELRKLAIGDSDDATERAWLALKTAMRSAGSYTSLIVDDPALAEAVLAIFNSWPEACLAELSPEMWANKRKEFGRVYRVMVDRALVGSRYLPGLCEQQNGGRADQMAYVPVKRLEAGSLRALSAAEAEQARISIAGLASGVKQLEAES